MLDSSTVRRYLRMEGEIQIAPRPHVKSLLDPHYDYVNARFSQGETNARRLFEELQQRGYRGGEVTVRNLVARLRKDLPGMAHPPRKAAEGHTQLPHRERFADCWLGATKRWSQSSVQTLPVSWSNLRRPNTSISWCRISCGCSALAKHITLMLGCKRPEIVTSKR